MTTTEFTTWRKSSYSGGYDNCVEVATSTDGHIGVRDSKHPTAGNLAFSPAAWQDFIISVRNNVFTV